MAQSMQNSCYYYQFPYNFKKSIMILSPLILLYLFGFICTSQPQGCIKYDPLQKSCVTCSKGYFLKNNECVSCFPCKQCSQEKLGSECQVCVSPYLKNDEGYCQLCEEIVNINGKDQCIQQSTTNSQNNSLDAVSVLFITLAAIGIAYVTTKLYAKFYQRENKTNSTRRLSSVQKPILKQFQQKTSEVETNTSNNNSRQSSAVLPQQQSHQQKDGFLNQQQSKLINNLVHEQLSEYLVLQSNIQEKVKLDESSPAQELGQLKLDTSVSLEHQTDICYYCKQLNVECQTQCQIQCHIECQIQQYKNLHKCFRCKSDEFHSFGLCQGCKQYKVKLIICSNECGEQEHLNCYGMLNYEEYCQKCKDIQKQTRILQQIQKQE